MSVYRPTDRAHDNEYYVLAARGWCNNSNVTTPLQAVELKIPSHSSHWDSHREGEFGVTLVRRGGSEGRAFQLSPDRSFPVSPTGESCDLSRGKAMALHVMLLVIWPLSPQQMLFLREPCAACNIPFQVGCFCPHSYGTRTLFIAAVPFFLITCKMGLLTPPLSLGCLAVTALSARQKPPPLCS